MKSVGRAVLVLPHPDDEVFCLHVLRHFEDYHLTFIYLTNGCPTNDLESVTVRQIESQRAIEVAFNGAEIFNYGSITGLTDGQLAREFSKSDIDRINDFIGQGPKPNTFISPILEGGHQDHDAAFMITENLRLLWGADHYAFPLYSSSRFPFPFFRTMKRSSGSITLHQSYKTRWSFVRTALAMIKIYKSQKKTWIGLTVPVLLHYALSNPAFYINPTRRIEHVNKFLYESRGYETRDALTHFQNELLPDS